MGNPSESHESQADLQGIIDLAHRSRIQHAEVGKTASLRSRLGPAGP